MRQCMIGTRIMTRKIINLHFIFSFKNAKYVRALNQGMTINAKSFNKVI